MTGCKKYLQLRSDEPAEKVKCLRALKAWCVTAKSYSRQRHHLAHFVSIDGTPEQSVIDASFIADKPVEKVKTDEELDAEAAAGEAAAKPKAKPKPGPKAKAREARGRGGGGVARGGRGRGRPEPSWQLP